MLRTIREAVLNRGVNRPAEKSRKLRVPKDPSEGFLLAASHFVTDRPVGEDDIMAHYESFPDLKGYLRALRTTGVIKVSDEDPKKFEFTPDGFQWAKDVLGRLRNEPAQWARADAHFKAQANVAKPPFGR